MKQKIKVFSINFDTKVKILIAICVAVAIIIISYSFYYIIIDDNHDTGIVENKKADNIETILDILSYDAEYDVTVNGNKTTNTYNVKEYIDLENKTFNMLIDDSLNIVINSNDSKITKNGMENEYIVSNDNSILTNNVMSFASIITCVKKISNKEISGNITRVEQDDKYIYRVVTDNCYIEKVKKIEICVLKENCKIIEIKMYNSDENELYSMVFKTFIVKK